jgi:hypothetical protein
MRTFPFNTLPSPLALALYNYQMETPVQSADELAELITALVEYLAVVALMDYFDGHPDPAYNGQNDNLNGWVITQLIFGKVEAGLWARWTQIAVQNTRNPRIPCLQKYVHIANLDDPASHLSRLLRFRNDVMHGGFVAPLPKIQAADALLKDLFEILEPLWSLSIAACIDEHENHWVLCNGLQPSSSTTPVITRNKWNGLGSILLIDSNQQALLALHPGCTIDPESHALNVQHHWKDAYHGWVARTPSLQAFYERYQKERSGWFDDTHWHQCLDEKQPTFGILPRAVDADFEFALQQRVSLLISGAPMEGKSTLVKYNLERLTRPFVVFDIEANSIQMDPNVLLRWVQESSTSNSESTVLVIDNSHRLGQGIYSNQSCQAVFELIHTIPQTVICIAPIQSNLRTSFDREIGIRPWTLDEIETKTLKDSYAQHVGYAPLIVDSSDGWTRLNQCMQQVTSTHPLAHVCMQGLLEQPRSLLELAEHIQMFTPKVEHTLNQLRDWIHTEESTTSKDIHFTLHPVAALWIRRHEEVDHVQSK